MWVLTRNRPTGPRRGTNVLILGAVSLLIGGGALVVHSWIGSTDAEPIIVVLVRIAAALVPLAWAALTVAGYREERRDGVRTYGATAGLILLAVFTFGAEAAMLPGLLDSMGRVG
jgi:hypothetical protein